MFKIIMGWSVLIGSIVGGLYVGGWLMFIQPIIEACKAFDAGTLTGLMIGITVLKCIYASAVSGFIVSIGSTISKALFESCHKTRRGR